MSEDLAKFRATYKSQFSDRASSEEGRLRIRKAPQVATCAKPHSPLPPKGKGSKIWYKFRDEAVARGYSEPERLADSLLRAREKAQEIEANRHTLQRTDKMPKPEETVVAAAPKAKRARTLPTGDMRCTATKMDGKQCEFKRHPDCGTFCSKHMVNKNLRLL